jgi:hypothetical protein
VCSYSTHLFSFSNTCIFNYILDFLKIHEKAKANHFTFCSYFALFWLLKKGKYGTEKV